MLADRARKKLSEGRPLEAIHLLDIALGADAAHRRSAGGEEGRLEALLRESGGANLSETMWLKSEIAAVEAALAAGA